MVAKINQNTNTLQDFSDNLEKLSDFLEQGPKQLLDELKTSLIDGELETAQLKVLQLIDQIPTMSEQIDVQKLNDEQVEALSNIKTSLETDLSELAEQVQASAQTGDTEQPHDKWDHAVERVKDHPVATALGGVGVILAARWAWKKLFGDKEKGKKGLFGRVKTAVVGAGIGLAGRLGFNAYQKYNDLNKLAERLKSLANNTKQPFIKAGNRFKRTGDWISGLFQKKDDEDSPEPPPTTPEQREAIRQLQDTVGHINEQKGTLLCGDEREPDRYFQYGELVNHLTEQLEIKLGPTYAGKMWLLTNLINTWIPTAQEVSATRTRLNSSRFTDEGKKLEQELLTVQGSAAELFQSLVTSDAMAARNLLDQGITNLAKLMGQAESHEAIVGQNDLTNIIQLIQDYNGTEESHLHETQLAILQNLRKEAFGSGVSHTVQEQLTDMLIDDDEYYQGIDDLTTDPDTVSKLIALAQNENKEKLSELIHNKLGLGETVCTTMAQSLIKQYTKINVRQITNKDKIIEAVINRFGDIHHNPEDQQAFLTAYQQEYGIKTDNIDVALQAMTQQYINDATGTALLMLVRDKTMFQMLKQKHKNEGLTTDTERLLKDVIGLGATDVADKNIDTIIDISSSIVLSFIPMGIGAAAAKWAVTASRSAMMAARVASAGNKAIRLKNVVAAGKAGLLASKAGKATKLSRFALSTALQGTVFYETSNIVQNFLRKNDGLFEGWDDTSEILKSMVLFGVAEGLTPWLKAKNFTKIRPTDKVAIKTLKNIPLRSAEAGGMVVGTGMIDMIADQESLGEQLTRSEFFQALLLIAIFRQTSKRQKAQTEYAAQGSTPRFKLSKQRSKLVVSLEKIRELPLSFSEKQLLTKQIVPKLEQALSVIQPGKQQAINFLGAKVWKTSEGSFKAQMGNNKTAFIFKSPEELLTKLIPLHAKNGKLSFVEALRATNTVSLKQLNKSVNAFWSKQGRQIFDSKGNARQVKFTTGESAGGRSVYFEPARKSNPYVESVRPGDKKRTELAYKLEGETFKLLDNRWTTIMKENPLFHTPLSKITPERSQMVTNSKGSARLTDMVRRSGKQLHQWTLGDLTQAYSNFRTNPKSRQNIGHLFFPKEHQLTGAKKLGVLYNHANKIFLAAQVAPALLDGDGLGDAGQEFIIWGLLARSIPAKIIAALLGAEPIPWKQDNDINQV